MAQDSKSVRDHYGQSGLGGRILAALERAGRDCRALTRDDLTAFDEFHIRGREATRELARLAGLGAGTRVLDVGCGIGGPARTLAAEFGCSVTGIDLSDEYCRAASMLTALVKLDGLAVFQQGDALEMAFGGASFDAVLCQHVGMNVEDKERMFEEVRRVLVPGGILALFEICSGAISPVHFPVPWAEEPSISFLLDPANLLRSLEQSGFREVRWEDQTRESLAWFEKRLVKTDAPAGGGAPLPGLELLMGATARQKLLNMKRNLAEDRIRVVRAVLRSAGADQLMPRNLD